METCVINNDVISEHELYLKCPSTLSEVSERDYPKKDYFSSKDILCLDMDVYEKNVLKKSTPEETVDAVIGISSYHHNRMVNPRLLLIELRMGYGDADNLVRKQQIDKVAHTRSLLSYETNIEKTSLFVFNDNTYPTAESLFSRWRNECRAFKNFETCSVTSFDDIIKSEDDMPYEPLHNESEIRRELLQFSQKGEQQKFINKINYLLQEAVIYSKVPFEFKFLKDLIKEEWDSFRKANPAINDENLELEAQILEEDIMTIFD